ncbi:hypothetical protein [Tomitella biformata]|nr:hypothetical protein [Tomitella biformata]
MGSQGTLLPQIIEPLFLMLIAGDGLGDKFGGSLDGVLGSMTGVIG